MLPQRRKSPEEIAKLRESMGLPVAPATPEEPSDATDLFSTPAVDEELPPPPPPKRVRSLRKSEQGPVERRQVPVRPAAGGAPIPVRKHSDKELAAMRVQAAAPPEKSIHHLQHLAAPKPLSFAGYALCFAGALAAWLSKWTPTLTPGDFPMEWMAEISRHPATPSAGLGLLIGCCALSLLISGWIAWKKPRSRHHAGFITILAVLVLAFGIVYHLPTPHGP